MLFCDVVGPFPFQIGTLWRWVAGDETVSLMKAISFHMGPKCPIASGELPEPVAADERLMKEEFL